VSLKGVRRFTTTTRSNTRIFTTALEPVDQSERLDRAVEGAHQPK